MHIKVLPDVLLGRNSLMNPMGVFCIPVRYTHKAIIATPPRKTQIKKQTYVT